jgi:SAM-dependent methyltransferase
LDAADWDQKYLAADHLWSHGPNLFVADRLASAKPGRGLDLASGEGRNAIWLAERGWEMTAVDFSPVALERGRSRSSSVDFRQADIRSWEADDEYDLVLIAYAHLVAEDFYDLTDRAKGWLAPAGERFMSGNDRSNIEHGHGGPQVPEILWDVAALREVLSDMEVVEAQVVRRPVDDTYALDALIRARRLA